MSKKIYGPIVEFEDDKGFPVIEPGPIERFNSMEDAMNDEGLEVMNRAEYLDDIIDRIDEDYDEYLDYLDKCCDAEHGHVEYPVKPSPPPNILVKEGSTKERPVKSIPAKPMSEKSSLTIESSDSKFWCDLIEWLDDYKLSDPSLTTLRLN